MAPLIDRADFPAVQELTYLNAASVAPSPRAVSQRVLEFHEDLAAHGTANFNDEAEARVYDGLREAAARLFNAHPDEIAAFASATEALSSLAWAVAPRPEQNVVSADVEFPSVVYPWLRVCRTTGGEVRLAKGRDGWIDPDEITSLIDNQTVVVCLSHVQYGIGQRLDMTRIARAAHRVGALFLVDATQSAGAVPIDVRAWEVDALVTGSYKWLCGPFGAAALYLRSELLDRLEPGLVGWRSTEDPFHLRADRIDWARAARRFEFSTLAYGSALGMAQAIEYLLAIEIEAIWKHNLSLADRLIAGLDSLGGQILSPRGPDDRSSIVTVRFPGRDSETVAGRLNERGIVVSPRMGGVRISPHLYNIQEDIDRALEGLEAILSGEEAAEAA